MDQVSRKEKKMGPGPEAGKNQKGERRVRNYENKIEPTKTTG